MNRPVLSLLLITYNQEDLVAQAVKGALEQTYDLLEIIISDDASSDATCERIQTVLDGYRGPHNIVFNRNPRNLGIGGNISHAVSLSSGDMIVIAAGDDISVPGRCECIAQAWVKAGCRPDLIASHLVDLDHEGRTHGVIVPTDLGCYRTVQDWLIRRPHVIGAAQAWTRRLFDQFGPLPHGVVAEDLIMVFRAICAGGCLTIAEPLVQYRRGGLSGRVRAMHAKDTIQRILANNRHALVEVALLRSDARLAGCEGVMAKWLDKEAALTYFIRDVFSAPDVLSKLSIACKARGVAVSRRMRLLTYAAWPWVLSPVFALKRALAR